MLWILFSDRAAAIAASSKVDLETSETVKGWLFLFVTAMGLYYVSQRMLTAVKEHERAYVRQLSILNHALQVAAEPIGFEGVIDAQLPEICEVTRLTQTAHPASQEAVGKS